MKICIMKNFEIDCEYQDLIKAIGDRIKDLRKEKGVSYISLAKEIGMSRNGYNNIELAKSNLQLITLIRILRYHNLSLFQFIDSLKR